MTRLEWTEYFSKICNYLIIEFIPSDDKKFIQMAPENRIDCGTYTEEYFLKDFCQYFKTIQRDPIVDSTRVLFLMKLIKEPLCSQS